ncbi:MAG: AMP-binding protein [Lachnospiraceae bacterium]|nr:AMP-binding protein [Lachnospiraceae bacterium]
MLWDLKQFGDNTALLDEMGVTLTYAQLNAEVETLSNAVGRRCLVFCLCENSIGSVLGYVAFMNAGIVPLLLNRHLDLALLENLLSTYCPSYIWLPGEQTGQISRTEPVYEARGYCLLRTHYDKEYTLHPELALLLTTSGSTGSPKFVRQSYENVLNNARAIANYLELDETERPITTLPMNYTYGLSIINSHLLMGATLLLTDKSIMQREFWSFFREARATSFGGVPYTYEMLDRMRFQRMALPALRTMTQAGGKLTPELHQKFAKYAVENGRKFIVMYGQCEATARMGYLPADKALEKCGSMGIAIPGGKFRLVDAKGNEITAPRVTGELVYEGRNVTLGYAERGEDLSKGDERHGVLETGDMAQFDEDGYFYIVGRKKRFLKIYGNRVNLDEVDRMVKGAFNLECASAGTDDHLYLFITEAGRAQEVRDFVARKTKLNPAAFKVVTLEEIPKNDSGKVLFRELEKYYERGVSEK